MSTIVTSRAVPHGVNPRVLVRGDVATITYTLGADYPLAGRKVYVCAKKKKANDNSTAIVNREATITSEPNRTVAITLTASETAAAGRYQAEIETRDAADEANPMTAYSEVWTIVDDLRK